MRSSVHRHKLYITPEWAGERLDKCLAGVVPGLSRTQVQQLLKDGHVRPAHPGSYHVKIGETYHVMIPAPVPSHLLPAPDIPFGIVYEDEDLLVINKPAGLTVHPGAGNRDLTLVNALLAHCQDSLSGIGGSMRPGIVHRLDKDTSGLLVVAKHDQAHQHLSAQIAARTAHRRYLAICYGTPRLPTGTIHTNIARSPVHRTKMAVVKSGGREAITHYRLQQSFLAGKASLISCQLETGRTHQIRVHLSHQSLPLIGDPVYTYNENQRQRAFPEAVRDLLSGFKRQALHAAELEFHHPRDERLLRCTAPLPEDMQALLDSLSLQADESKGS
jgi:23S rRNA pseudouridine1911/1915/1917 synthase